jgi:hypothetical protein
LPCQHRADVAFGMQSSVGSARTLSDFAQRA